MKSTVNAMVSFGLVNVPVGIAPAVTGTNEITFRRMHNCGHPVVNKDSGKVKTKIKTTTVSTIKQHLFCEACGVEVDETVKGYEYATGHFVTISEDELEAIAPSPEKVITLNKFVPRNNVTGLMVEKDYFLIPNPKVNAGYGVLYQALAETKTIGFGTQALWGKEHPCAVVANQDFEGGVLMMQVLRQFEDMVMPDFKAPIPNAAARKLAKELVLSHTGTLVADEDLVSQQRVRLNALVAAKMAGVDLPAAAQIEEAVPSTDLMDALKQSVAVKEKPKPRTKAKT